MTNSSSWSSNVVEILENVRVNCVNLSEIHRRTYFYYKNLSNYFDIPIIVISTLAGSWSVGASTYMEQNHISLVSCITSMLITILASIKLYLNINQNLENEGNMAREFYTLSIEIYKMITLPVNQRSMNGIDFLNQKYTNYIKLYEESNLLKQRYKKDRLVQIDPKLIAEFNCDSSSSSVSSTGSHESPRRGSIDTNPLNITIE